MHLLFILIKYWIQRTPVNLIAVQALSPRPDQKLIPFSELLLMLFLTDIFSLFWAVCDVLRKLRLLQLIIQLAFPLGHLPIKLLQIQNLPLHILLIQVASVLEAQILHPFINHALASPAGVHFLSPIYAFQDLLPQRHSFKMHAMQLLHLRLELPRHGLIINMKQ